MKKPRSRVDGDIFRELVGKYCDVLVVPLHHVFLACYRNGSWPGLWKRETVTVISKCPRPSSLGELRNLSRTPLFSKLMESFILQDLKKEIKLHPRQFGGIKGAGVDHFLIKTWIEILCSLEEGRAAVTLASIDFEKAFNWVCHN